MFVSLLGLGIGITFASFQVCGIVFVLSAMLKMFVRNVSAKVPKCLRCLMFMLSGPVELLFLECLMASSVCVSVISIRVALSFWVCLSIFL